MGRMDFLLLLASLIILDTFCAGQEEAKQRFTQNLFRKLSDGYYKYFLPRINESEPVKVHFEFTLITIKEVNAKDQTITVYGWVRQRWHNPFLQWNASEYDGIESIHTSAERVWVPDILVYNNVDLQDRMGGGPTTYKTNVVIRSSGHNDWTSPALFKTVCAIDVTYFPFDMQTCSLKFGSWASSSKEITMIPGNTTGKSDQYVDNGEWDLVVITSKRNIVQYRYEAFDDVTVTIGIGRVYFTFCVNLIIPCFLISTMIFLGFILPPECGERIGLSITVLLAMTVFQQLTSNIFPSFDFPLLGQYYFATSVEISISLVATTIVLNFTARKNKKIPRWLRTLLLKWTARVVFLRKTVIRSCPKPNRRRKSTRIRSMKERTSKENNAQGARQNGSIAQIISEESTLSVDNDQERKDDRLVEELKNVFIISKNLDYGGLRYANSLKSNDSGNHLTASALASEEAWEEGDAPFTGVHDENGEELEESELALRQWEWVMAARVLDRALLLVSIVVGIATFVAIFLRAPRVQELLLGSSNNGHSHCED